MKRLILSIFLLFTLIFVGTTTDMLASHYLVTIDVADHGYTIPSAGGPYQYVLNSDFKLEVFPENGYDVEQILVNTNPIDLTDWYANHTNPILNLQVDQHYTIVVTFKQTTKFYDINATAGPNGKIEPAGKLTYDSAAMPCYTITPDANFEIDELTVDGISVVPIQNPYCFTELDANHTINVTFKELPPPPDTFDLNITYIFFDVDGNVTTTPGASNTTPYAAGSHDIVENTNVNITFNPEAYWIVYALNVDGNPVNFDPTNPAERPTNYDFGAMTSNHTLEVTFKHDPISILEIEIPSLKISPNPVNGISTIIKGNEINFTRIDVVDIMGNVVMSIENPTNVINFSNLAIGNYIVRFYTEKGFATRSIIKN